MCFFEQYKTGYLLRIKLAPSAARKNIGCGVCFSANDECYLKASVVSIPEKGKANKELLKILAKELHIAQSQLEIISGEVEHWKKIYLKIKPNSQWDQKLQQLKKE